MMTPNVGAKGKFTIKEPFNDGDFFNGEVEVVYSDGMCFTTDITDVEFGLEHTIFGYSSKKVVTIYWEVTDDWKKEILKLKKQVEISKAYFQNILEVNPNIRIGSPSHLVNCVNVMKNSAEKALKILEEVEND